MNLHRCFRAARRTGGARRAQRGVSLVEVLVSVVLVTLGLLGAAALQASALRNNQGSYERTQTSILTQGIFDAMRANLAGVDGDGYDTGGWVCTAPNGAGLANTDIARWIGDLQQQIHAGACGNIDCNGRACTVRVRWDDSRATAGSTAHVVEMRAQL
jgi:type IV pilus assembly protein PilV